MNPLKKTFLLFLSGIQCQMIMSQATLAGRIVNKTSGEPLPYATIVLKKDSITALTGILSDSTGYFVFEGIRPGDYLLSCSFIGFKTINKAIHIGTLNTSYNYGKIGMEPEVTHLNEVVVTAQKDIVSSGLEKKTFDIAGNISQTGGSVLEAMKNLPGVTIDQEGKVFLRGSDKVAILIDGKPSGLTGFGNQKGLDNIPVSRIDHIEIINNPSSRYDASGMAGIINIIYKKEKQNGFNAEAGITGGFGEYTTPRENLPGIMPKYSFTPKASPFLSLNYRTKKINWFVQTDGMTRKRVNTNEFTSRTYTDGTPASISQFLENRTQQMYNLKSGIDWYLNSQNSITLYGLWQYESHIDRGHVPYDYSATGTRYRFWTWAEDEHTSFLNAGGNYRHKFTDPGHELNLSFIYTVGGENEYFPFTDSSASRISTDATHLIVKEKNTSLALDYFKPLKQGKLESGAKIRLRDIPISYSIFPGMHSILDTNLGTWSDYMENIYAGYLNYLYESVQLDIETGMRLEYTDLHYSIDPANRYYTRNEAYHYLSLFPTARVSYKFSNNNTLSLFYNRRIDRPGEFELRPFPKYDDPEILKTGNPYLRPQFTQTFEMAYKKEWPTGSFYLAGYYRMIHDIFSRIYTRDSLSLNVINTIPQNLGKGTNLGFETALSKKITRYWNLNASVNVYRNTINAFSGYAIYPYRQPFNFPYQMNYTWNTKINNDFLLSEEYEIQLTGVYYAPDIIPQGTIRERYSIDVGMKKKIWKGKGEITCTATDIFHTFGIRKKIEGDGFVLYASNYYETQLILLGIKYKF